MKSKCISINIRRIKDGVFGIVKPFLDDRISVYAAQASFFISVSSIPFIMLLLHMVRLVVPNLQNDVVQSFSAVMPSVISDLINSVVEELYGKINFSVISISALTLLWTASRGIKSIANGVRNIFGSRTRAGYVGNIIQSLILTLVFIAFMIASLVFIAFGRRLIGFLTERLFPSGSWLNFLFALRLPLFFAALVFLFWIAYYGMAHIRCKLIVHLPGAVLASVGWVVFSWLYSLYIDYFANYSFVYGSLAAVILLMLWLYFCMVIFLSGAEINKLLLIRKQQKDESV